MVTPAVVRAIVAPTMTTNNKANAALDTPLLRSYESGSAFAIDSTSYRLQHFARQQHAAGGASAPFTLALSQLGVPHQPTWPAEFLAVGSSVQLKPSSGTGSRVPSCESLLDFEKMSAAGRWRIIIEPTTLPKATPPLATSRGFVLPLTPAEARRADAVPSAVTRDFVNEETGSSLGPFTKADLKGNRCWQLPDPRAEVQSAEAAGVGARVVFSVPSPADTAAFPLSGSRTLVLFTVRLRDELIAGASGPIVWRHRSLKRYPQDAYTELLPVGRYSEVDETTEVELAVVLPPAGASGPAFSVIGTYQGFVAITGRRASGGTGPVGTLAAERLP